MTYMAREPYANFWPKVADTAFVAESADLIGDVTIGEHASVWYHTTLRADINKIVIGDYSNIQDNSCIHLADDFGCYVGKYVTVGHGVILHACMVEDGKILRSCEARVIRDKTPVFDGKMSTLRRFQDEVEEVKAGLECGIRLGDFNEYETGDIIECYMVEQIPAK